MLEVTVPAPDPAESAPDAQTVRIAPEHAARVGLVKRALIIVGSANYEAALGFVPTDTLIVGLSGAAEWLAANGAPHPDLARVVRRERDTVVFLLLGNTEADAEVWTSADKLGQHLKALGAKGVSIVTTAGFQLSALLEATPSTARAAYIETILGAAGPLGRRPKASRGVAGGQSMIAPMVDVEAGLIYRKHGEEKEILLEAAASILRTFKVYDDLKDQPGKKAIYSHDLEVVVIRGERRQVHMIPDVPDSDLAHPRSWLNLVPGGTKIIQATGHGVGESIERAIRAHESDLVPEIEVLTRTGWAEVNGTIGFLHPGGFNTVAGRTDIAKSQLAESFDFLRVEDTSELSPEAERAAAINSLEMFEELTNPAVWIALWGPAMYSIAGLGVGAVPLLEGKRGSGKSVIAMGITGHLAAAFNPDGRSMAVIDSSAKNTAKAGNGLESLFILFDDARKRSSGRAAEAQAEAVEAIVRPGYAGGFAAAGVNVYNQKRSVWELGVPDLSSPMRGIICEVMPYGENLDSTLERFFPARIEDGQNIFRSGNGRRYKELAVSGMPTTHTAAFIRWIAEGMEKEGGIKEWRDHLAPQRRAFEDARSELPVSIRIREVAAVVETGMMVWLDYLAHIHAVSPERREELGDLVNVTVTAVARFHGTTNIAGLEVKPHEQLLNSLRAAVVSGKAWVSHLQGHVVLPEDLGQLALESTHAPNAPLLAVEVKARGNTPRYLAIQPRDALQVLATEPRFRSLTENDLFKAFAAVSLTDGSGKLYKTSTVGGLRTKVLALPYSEWVGKDASGGTAGPPAEELNFG